MTSDARQFYAAALAITAGAALFAVAVIGHPPLELGLLVVFAIAATTTKDRP